MDKSNLINKIATDANLVHLDRHSVVKPDNALHKLLDQPVPATRSTIHQPIDVTTAQQVNYLETLEPTRMVDATLFKTNVPTTTKSNLIKLIATDANHAQLDRFTIDLTTDAQFKDQPVLATRPIILKPTDVTIVQMVN